MQKNKLPSPKHQPKGVALLYEDADILVVDKPCGLLTMGTDRDKSRTVHSILNDYVRRGNPKSRNRVYIVHRLDRDTSGVLLFAKSEQAKLFLQSDWENTTKIYLTVVFGHLDAPQGTISSYLTENAAFTVYSTADPEKGKLSQTAYTLVKELKGLSLLRIHLLTGRKHQIRVHFAEKGHPVVGDRKYGKGHASYPNLALHACSISFTHPVSGASLRFETKIPILFKQLVGSFEMPDI
ncbi:MAG: RNA pseudouridine synthase [Geobacteraceae bacterium GWC2_58_44]|nr:MAG: RNA pseudouridine synthase [Geobacteraceae bacterium GWC2_58_44]HBG08235.1 RNA pseudouridine synthase [Geobacter sp.]